MGARRSGREAALQMLFAMEALASSPDEVVRGVAEHRDEIDKVLASASENWRVERMTRLDRNLLRLGTFELMKRSDVPSPVILDEAVELAKQFGTDESSAFVNGVLNRVAHDVGRKDVPSA